MKFKEICESLFLLFYIPFFILIYIPFFIFIVSILGFFDKSKTRKIKDKEEEYVDDYVPIEMLMALEIIIGAVLIGLFIYILR